MKKAILMMLAAGVLLSPLSCCKEETAQNVDKAQIVLDNIAQRKSVRSYTNEPVAKEQLEKLVRAGMAAPSAVNKQPWAFIVLSERAAMDALAEKLPHAKMLKEAPAAIVVCGDMDKALEGDGREYWVQDASAATQNILLAAEAMGLGAVWTGAYPVQARVNDIKAALSLPENIIPLDVIPVGHPAGDDKPKDKWKPENVHWEKW